ncbi:hypothetical protein GOODEAATRI_005214, partial [Goodea atripinnis]
MVTGTRVNWHVELGTTERYGTWRVMLLNHNFQHLSRRYNLSGVFQQQTILN